MSGQQHQFPGVFSNNQQAGLRSQFVPGQMAGGMSNQMGPGMQSQMPSHLQNISMGNQMPNQMNASINSGLGPQMTNTNTGGGMQVQMLGQLNQQYMSTGLQNNQLSQQQVQLQMQQQQMQQQLQQQQVQQVQQMQQNQQSNVQNPPATTPTPSAPAQSKEFNTVSLCRFGQETVQDIVSRTQEVFSTLRTLQPPNGTAQGSNMSNERKAKVQEQLRTIRLLFKRLRLIYEKCNESCQLQGMEYTHIESLIPLKDELDVKSDEKKTSEAYRSVCEEHKEYMEQVVLKNKQLKEVIDHLRRIIWEINTMLNMRRS